MKVHDRFVIELSEIIKGYGNDYQANEPFKLPCDYKFYEISGVAICEDSFKKMKPLEDEIKAVLEQIRTEIADEKMDIDLDIGQEIHYNRAIDDVLAIIDKYTKGERE